MTHHIVAYSESLDPAGAYANHAAVPDQSVAYNGDLIYIPSFASKLIGAWAGADATAEVAAYLQSPSLLARSKYHIQPVAPLISPGSGLEVRLHPQSPIDLDISEGLEALILANPAAATVNALVAFLADGSLTPVVGEIIQCRFSTAITETVAVWSNGAISLDDELPSGKYQIVGAAMYGTSGVAFRLVIPGERVRPGFTCNNLNSDAQHPLQRYGGMGVWAEFETRNLPSVDWLAHATAGTAQVGILDLIRVS